MNKYSEKNECIWKRQLTDNPGGPGGPVGPVGPPTPYFQEIKIMFPLRPQLITAIHANTWQTIWRQNKYQFKIQCILTYKILAIQVKIQNQFSSNISKVS